MLFQDPSVASVTSNAARGLEDFNPFADQNTSQASGAKVGHFRTLFMSINFRLGFKLMSFDSWKFMLIRGLLITAISARGSSVTVYKIILVSESNCLIKVI